MYSYFLGDSYPIMGLSFDLAKVVNSIRRNQSVHKSNYGSMLEWLMGTDCKSAGNAYAGSNPARPKYEAAD